MNRSAARTVIASAVLAPLAVVGLGACSSGVHHSAKLATAGSTDTAADSGSPLDSNSSADAVGSAASHVRLKQTSTGPSGTGHGTGLEGVGSPGGGQGTTGGGASSGGAPAPAGSGGSVPAPLAHFTDVHPTIPATCVVGSLVTPKLTWHTVGASGVALSVDNPGLVGAFGNYEANGTLDMPAISCTGSIGGHTATHRYDVDTVGGSGHERRTVHVSMTIVGPPLPPPVTAPPTTGPIYKLPPVTVPPPTIPSITPPPISIPCLFC